MDDIKFNWISHELLTKKRMDQFTDFLHQQFGYLHTLNNGDYGFGLNKGQIINSETINNQIKITLPPMRIIFPGGFLCSLDEQTDLAIESGTGLLCLGLSNDGTLTLFYCANESEAILRKFIPILHTSSENYLKPVLQIKNADEYAVIIKKFEHSIDSCLLLINNYFLATEPDWRSTKSVLCSIIFQSYLSALQKIKFDLITGSNLGSFSFINLFKPLLWLTESFRGYFDKIDDLSGVNNKYSTREQNLIENLSDLIKDLNLLHTNEKIKLLEQWLNYLYNTIKVYSAYGGSDNDPKEIENKKQSSNPRSFDSTKRKLI